MMKTAKYKYITPAYARYAGLLVLLLLGMVAQGQGYYTLTNGRLWWSNGLESQPDEDWRDPVAFDASRTDAKGNWLEVHPHGNEHVTNITAQGDTYLALDLRDGYTNPKIASSDHFTLYCVWQRTGTTGYYYQEWHDDISGNTYNYYLIGSSEDSEPLKVIAVQKDRPMTQSTYWYNWDFGAAVWETPTIDGVKKNRYYWIMLQTRERDNDAHTLATPVWTLSEHCYQRPEDIYYTSYTEGDASGNARRLRYYDTVYDGFNYFPVGNGALFMPVTVTPHDKAILAIENDGDGNPYGLQATFDPTTLKTLHTGITITDDESNPVSSLEYVSGGVSVNLAAVMNYKNGDKVPMTVRPAYTDYFEEKYRRGIHLNYRNRTEEGVFGSAGVAVIDSFYLYGDELHDSKPNQISEEATVDSIYFTIDNRSLRYVELDTVYPMNPAANRGKAILTFKSPVSSPTTVKIYLRVRYSNGSEQYDTAELALTYTKPDVDLKPVHGPVVRGAVFGGGRMANVTGGTVVTVHSTDSIPTLYGGNDIAGWVQGTAGANITLGTEFTSGEHPIHIGNVYGGGNGYYTYQGINAGYDEATDAHYNPYWKKQSTSLMYSAYYFNGKVYPWNTLPSGYLTGDNDNADRINKDETLWTSLPLVTSHEFTYTPYYIGHPDLVDQAETGDDGDGTIPYIKTAHITVGVPEGRDNEDNPTYFICGDGDSTHWHNDYILIDTLFGGARNAFIGVTANEGETPENGVTIDIHGGTIFSVFGGNNVGGSVANTSTVFVNVYDTKLIDADAEVEDTYLNGFGRDFGIRYLFGGGNLVDGSHANVAIRGGLLDTVYLGGNNATVKTPIGLVDCPRGDENEYGYTGHFICTNETYPDNSTFTDPVAALDANEDFFEGYGPDHFSPEEGMYNVRCLFGGNNAADMNNLTTIMLHSGGISCVYGGGNEGDMTNDGTFTDPLYASLLNHSFDLDPSTGNPIANGWADIYGKSTLPQKVGTIVTALQNSKIVCDYVFGGSRMGNIKNSCGVYLAGGTYGYVTGGNDVSGDVGSETGGGIYVVIDSNVLVVGDVVGGSDGYYHCDDGSGHYDHQPLYDTYSEEGNAFSYDPYDDYVELLLPTHNSVNLYMRGGLVLGQAVGGGVHTNVGFENPTGNKIRKLLPSGVRGETNLDLSTIGGERRGSVHFLASGGRILGNAFGGGFQSKIFGLAYITLKNNIRIDGSFFAGNDCTGSINHFGAYYNTNDYDSYRAEGKTHEQALVAAYEDMVASDGTPLNQDNGDGTWSATYSAYLRIKDTPQITCVYGSGNGAYDYDGEHPEYGWVSFCPDPNGYLPLPKQSSTFIDINTSGGSIDTVFGGGNGVGVEESVLVLLNNTGNNVHTVHTIFGGNNVDDMLDVVPDIQLKKGVVNTVFGGANNGAMGASWSFADVNGDMVKNVSTHVALNSADVTILDTLFGGCRMSDVKGVSYVEVRNTTDDGVRYVFGGNDISGNIDGSTRVDVSGGVVKNLFGGSDGRYDFVEIGDNRFKIYPFGYVETNPTYFDGHELSPADSAELEKALITIAGRPDVDSTSVNLWGGSVGTTNGGVYGGGSMADARTTCVTVNDTVKGHDRLLNIYGAIYGGGMGDYEHLNNYNLQGTRYGNVEENTHVHLYHADLVSSAKAYGGGRGGDVMNTYINTYDGWDTPFESLFGGCWGSDVHGTAHLDFKGVNLVNNLFGGNDFAGDVYKSVIDIHSGRFNNIYGGGNGDYPISDYNSGIYEDDLTDPNNPIIRHLHRPNTEFITITINDGVVNGNFYGGGKLGSTWNYQKDENRQYVLVNGHKVPDISLTTAQAHTNPLDYSYIISNIHGGVFNNDVFGGASGRGGEDGNALVYGVKVINMDGGKINRSLYGGSESVDDGYASECTGVGSSETTLRPSSIINMTGGIVESNLYGAGYLGTTYGSVYVNVGPDAIDSCVAYRRSYSSGGAKSTVDNAYWVFKPGEEGSLSDTLVETPTMLNHSVYAGANWGAGSGSASFNTSGFVGGESMIRIDGKGYNTGADETNLLPSMNVRKSLFGSGTSVKGGDVRSDINLWNYGELSNCRPTKELESVQRTGQFFSHNTAVHYLGATDASDAYISEPYTILRADTMSFRGFNVAEYDEPLSFVTNLYNYEEDLDEGELELVPIQPLREVATSDNACANTSTMCDFTHVVSPTDTDKKHTLLVLNNGIDFKIQLDETPIMPNYYTPGYVYGFCYLTTPYGYSSSVTALSTAYYDPDTIPHVQSWLEWGYDWNSGFAGFVSPCKSTNKYTTKRDGYPMNWLDESAEGYVSNKAELPYENFISEELEFLNYREWKVGTGVRLREAAIRAHIDPTQLAEDVNVKINDTNLALAKATITLPATSEGHYYKFNNDGIIISGSNSTANLVDEAWATTTDFETLAADYSAGTDVKTKGAWKKASLEEGGLSTGRDLILSYPDNTFGLVMQPGENFKTDAGHYVMPSIMGVTEAMSSVVLSGNSYYNASANFCSPKVAEGDRIMPSMDLLLTYSPTFASTFLGTVEFTLDEYDENNDYVGPVKVKVYISTIIESFRDMETSVLAMFNNDVTNTFTRRVILPITLDENRELYITSVKWEPTNGDGSPYTGDYDDFDPFYMVENGSTITSAPHDVNNLFGMHLVPNDAVTGDLNENLGWTSIDEADINIFRLARAAGADAQRYAADGNTAVDLTSGGETNGRRLGILDGRGSAALNVTLLFDGSRIYPAIDDKGYLGKVVLGMRWKKGENSGDYNFTINVKSRSHGDTIYLASAESVTRGSYTVHPYTYGTSYYHQLLESGNTDSVAKAPTVIGKSPDCYVQSFQHALSSNVYQEGDVIAIIDQVNINERPVHIQGADGPPIQVIRYEGHHHQLPDEVGVYRGPMIVVSGQDNLFTAKNIDFHGSAGAHIKRVCTSSDPDSCDNGFYKKHEITVGGKTYKWDDDTVPGGKVHFEPDTNRAYGPIIAIKNNGAVTLSEGTLVRHNWNAYGSETSQRDATTGWPLSSENMGAISVTGGGTLTLKGDVMVRDNFSHTLTGYDNLDPVSVAKAPGNGAIYVDGGHIVLPESHKNTAVDITRNRLMTPAIHDPSGAEWWQMATIEGVPSRFTLDTTLVYTTWKKANVYLTRTEPTSGSAAEKELNDVQSDVFSITGALGTKTRIGVRKWFPGPTTRDTIRIAVNNSYDFVVLENAYENKNFQSDDGFNVFYNQSVSSNNLYLFRCATFKHQLASQDMPLVRPGGTAYKGQDVLHYGIQKANTCPLGGDTIVYRLQGGFAPYTYTWKLHDNDGAADNYDILMDEHTTPYTNAEIQKALTDHDTAHYWSSIIDTFLTPRVEMARAAGSRLAKVKVTAVDATGECSLTKYLNITIRKVNEYTDIPEVPAGSGDRPLLQLTTTPTNGWTSVETEDEAEAIRYFKGIKITPYVYTDPSVGTIDARTGDPTDDSLYQYIDETHSHALTDLRFCEGDVIKLKTRAEQESGSKFLMWSFNPYTTNPATYVVPNHDDDVIAYYGPTEYWKDHINTSAKAGAALASGTSYTGRPTVEGYTSGDGRDGDVGHNAGYVTTYNDDVHIYDENGLAWFISVVNGLNGTQARPFRFNTVYLHKKANDTDYDMKDYLWSPVGTLQYGFRGRFVCVGKEETSTTPLDENDFVTVRNFILNEPDMENVAVFSFLDGAEVTGLNIRNIFVRGGHFVSALAASSQKSTIQDVGVDYVANPNPAEKVTSILSTHYAVGTLIGKSKQDQVAEAQVANIKLVGDAVYVGGAVAQGVADVVRDSYIIGYNETNGNISGGIQGEADGEPAQGLFRRKSSGTNTYIANNYVHMRNVGSSQNMGGIVGHAENTVLENNYVYGSMNGSDQEGGVAASMGNNSRADKNYYAQGDARQGVGMVSDNASVSDIASFRGKGNQVTLEEPVYGVSNLTRVLNKWVREHNAEGGNYKTWRSDLEGTNNGYPVFGEPDMIPVNAHETIDGCEVVVLGGVTYTRDTVITTRVIDNDEMIDSTLTATIRLHYGTQTALFDSALLADGYDGYGFSISPSELELLNLTLDSAGHVSLVFSDTLTTVYGCDSIVTLTLTFTGDPDQPIVETVTTVKVYPNPTTSVVNVETDEMSHVEVYDNEGRKLQDYDAAGRKKVVVDMTSFVTGIYFVRVHTPNEVIIQKVIKQR